MTIAIIGGGAAGFFAAINCAIEYPGHSIVIFEKSNKVLAKVRVSGGGRCNVTNGQFDNSRLEEYYPRGNKELRNAFSRFGSIDTVNWFSSRGVSLKTEADGRMFPVTDNSETVIQCLLNEAEKYHVKIKLSSNVKKINKNHSGKFELIFENEGMVVCDKVIVTSGGNSNRNAYQWLEDLGHSVIAPVPSLFTFNLQGSPLKGLEGISKQSVTIRLEGFKYASTGPLLITHWGISGPAVLRLSSFAARWLNEHDYTARCFINWTPALSEDELREEIFGYRNNYAKRKIISAAFYDLPSRLWQRLCYLSGIDENDNCADLNKVQLNKLVQNISNMSLQIKGKTTFKEEFVTCGGIDLKDVDMKTMESKKQKGLYFAGEILNVDGITGGFNFQAAWTTGFLAGINAGNKN